MSYPIKGQDGRQGTLRAASYVLDWQTGYVRLNGVELHVGDTFAKADSVVLTGLHAVFGSDQIFKARVSNISGRLVRLESGRFELQDYLPEQTQEKSDVRFLATLSNVQLDIVDRAGTPWSEALSTQEVLVAGVGNNWIAHGRGSLRSAGDVDLRIQNLDQFGLSVVGQSSGLQLASLANHLTTTPDARQIPEVRTASVGSAVLRGPFRVFLPAKASLRIESSVVAEVRDLRYGRYRVDSANFRGIITELGASGEFGVRAGPNRATGRGRFRWDKTQRFGGYISASSPSPDALPAAIRALIPKDVGYSAAGFNGYLVYDPRSGPRLTGQARADSASYQGQRLVGIDARIRYQEPEVLIKLDKGVFQGQQAGGVLAFNPKTQSLTGGLDAVRVDLSEAGKLIRVPGLSGYAIVSATVTGTTRQPVVDFTAHGSGLWRHQGRTVDARVFEAAGRYTKDRIELDRAMIDSPTGLLVANGSIGSNGQLSIEVQGRGIRPETIDDHLGGSANLEAKVTGTLENPHFAGSLEGYALTYNDEMIPVAKTSFKATLKEAHFSGLQAVRGSAVINGSGKYVYATKAIQGDFNAEGIQIGEFLGEDVAGAVNIPSLEIAGTLDRPVITGQLRGTNLLARGVKISMINARLQTVGRKLRLSDTFAQAAGGTVTANGEFDLDTRNGAVTLTASHLDIEDLIPEFSSYLAAGGQLDGEVAVTIQDNKLDAATGSGNLKSISVNETALGNGSWSVGTSGHLITAEVEIGQLDRFVTLRDLSFNTETKAITGELSALNQQLPDLVAISKRYLPDDLSYEVKRTINSVQGQLNLEAKIAGTSDHPIIDVPVLEASDISVRDTKFESLTANLQRTDNSWDIRTFRLLGDPNVPKGLARRGQAVYEISGTFVENGPVNMEGEFTNIGLSDFAAFEPSFTGRTGEADVSVRVSGESAHPTMRASLSANGLLGDLDPKLMAEVQRDEEAGALTDEQRTWFYGKTLSIDLPEINISEGSGKNAGARFAGKYTYRGFQGELVANAPFAYPLTIPETEPASGRITLDSRNLADISEYVEALDPKRTQGSIHGLVSASGTPHELVFNGNIKLLADTLALDDMTDPVQKLDTTIDLSNQVVTLTAKAESPRGGALTANASANIGNLSNFSRMINDGFVDALLKSPVSGEAKLADVGIFQNIADGHVGATIGGDITVAGTLRRPQIAGDLAVKNAETVIPGFDAAERRSETPTINPSFKLALHLATPVRVKSSAADLYLLGNGSINGTLDRPDIRADLYVDKGNLNLPGSRIRIDQGGTVAVRYAKTAVSSDARVDVNMEGHTAVTAARYGDVLERYDVTLGIRGDLLTEGGLLLTASSDPPDLSQDRILALIGQTDLLSSVGTGLAGGGFGSDTQAKLRSALVGFALPSLLDPVTSGISKSLGLDYLSLEYNAYDQAALVFSKPLGGGFSIQGRRQLTAPPPGFQQEYDIRLTYRPRRLPNILNRFSFSVGADEQRPWKIAIEYGTRF